jgi:3-mercaptopyruvate sulfurtransferase SseA
MFSLFSGIAGSNIAFALHLLRAPDVAMYEGGWTEWAQRADDTLKATGPA